MTVYECIAAVSEEISTTGILKTHTNSAQGYKFRGIDDTYNALAPMLAYHKLVILPRMLSRTQTEKQTAKGGTLFAVVVEAEFDFVSATDSTKHTVKMYGEAMDSGDKATNKAMSAAYKYACFQTFCIPTCGDGHDSEEESHEVLPTVKPVVRSAASTDKSETKVFPSSAGDVRPISEAQQRRMFAIAKTRNVSANNIKMYLALQGIESTGDIKRQDYESITAWIEAGGDVAIPEPEFTVTLDDVPF